MSRLLLLSIVFISLAGCTSTTEKDVQLTDQKRVQLDTIIDDVMMNSSSPSYNIDVTCNNQAGNAFFICDPLQKDECDEATTIYSCYYPGSIFHIKCDKSTVQTIGGVYSCTTHDGKSVRIRVI